MKNRDKENKILSEYLYPDRCFHEWKSLIKPGELRDWKCIHCSAIRAFIKFSERNVDFFSPDSPRRLLEELVEKVIKDFHFYPPNGYWKALSKAVGYDDCVTKSTIIAATTSQIATACLELVGGKKK